MVWPGVVEWLVGGVAWCGGVAGSWCSLTRWSSVLEWLVGVRRRRVVILVYKFCFDVLNSRPHCYIINKQKWSRLVYKFATYYSHKIPRQGILLLLFLKMKQLGFIYMSYRYFLFMQQV